MTDATPPATGTTDDATTAVPVTEAAARLGITSEAVRARIRRGKLEAVKRENVWHVMMPAGSHEPVTSDATKPDNDTTTTTTGTDTTEPAADDALIDRLQDENAYLRSVLTTAYDQDTTPADDRLISKLESEVAYLRDQLDKAHRTAERERERADVLQREALQRLEALTAGHGAPGATESAGTDATQVPDTST